MSAHASQMYLSSLATYLQLSKGYENIQARPLITATLTCLPSWCIVLQKQDGALLETEPLRRDSVSIDTARIESGILDKEPDAFGRMSRKSWAG